MVVHGCSCLFNVVGACSFQSSPKFPAATILCAMRRKFFELLPGTFGKFGESLLKDDGKIKVKGHYHSWKILIQRVPSYLDIVLSGKPTKEYSKSVFSALLDVFPRETNPAATAKKRLISFLSRVDEVAPPIMIL